MRKIILLSTLLFVLIFICSLNAHAKEGPLGVKEFRQLYDRLLAGRTLVTETTQDGVVIKKERQFGKAVDVGDGEFDIPVSIAITKTKEGRLEQKTTINMLDRVNNLGGQAIIDEVVRKTTVEKPGSETLATREVEFNGLFRVAKNDKGGFEVHNFGLVPSILSDGDSLSLSGSMISYFCFPENGRTKCILTIRDYKLGDYKPLVGYTLIEPAGGDFVEVTEEVRP
ncbi:MAG: hypothetical protein L0Y68_02585 [Candidatus Dadabacteria bacterium]|nr:hypothetical protein [Candidatus Dadabacteria bacterium]